MSSQVKNRIGLWSCVAFAVGAMVGAGVFVLSGVAVQKTGPGALLSFLIAGLAVLCSAVSFATVSALAQPKELGYAPVGRILGHRFWGFLVSWSFYIAALIGTAFVLHAFGVYMHDFFISSVSSLAWSLVGAGIMTLLNVARATNISRIEDFLVLIKVVILVLLIGFGIVHFSPGTLTPFMPHGTASVISTSGLLFIAYLGFSVVTNIAGDVRDAPRTVPRAILLSVAVVMVLYAGVVIALLAFPLKVYDEASVGRIAQKLMGPTGGVLIPVAALVSTLSAANSNILGASDIMVRLAARRDVPTVAGRLWNGHPLVSVLFGAVVYVTLLIVGRTDSIIALANVTAISAIIVINIAAARVVLQRRKHRWLRVILPSLGFASCIAELSLLGVGPILIGFAMVAAGGLLYVGRIVFHDETAHRRLLYDLEAHGGPMVHAMQRMEHRVLHIAAWFRRRKRVQTTS